MSEGSNLPAVTKQVNLVAGERPQAIVPIDYAGVARFANTIFESGLAPKELDSPQKVAVVLFYGLELSIPPMMALGRVAVINGRPALWGDGALALIYSRNVAEFVDERVEGEGEAMVAICTTKRRGFDNIVERRFSAADAIQAGLWSTDAQVTRWKKDGSTYKTRNDSPWFRMPRRMLQMRARGFALRDAYPDVLMGLYLAEELQGEREPDPTPADDLPPNPHKEITDGTAANAGVAGDDSPTAERDGPAQDRSNDAGVQHDHPETAAPAVVEETAADQGAGPEGVSVADAAAGEAGAVVEETAGAGDDLPDIGDPDDFAAGVITRLSQVETEDQARDLMTDEGVWVLLEAVAFSRRTADALNDAFERALERTAAPEDDLPPNPMVG